MSDHEQPPKEQEAKDRIIAELRGRLRITSKALSALLDAYDSLSCSMSDFSDGEITAKDVRAKGGKFQKNWEGCCEVWNQAKDALYRHGDE